MGLHKLSSNCRGRNMFPTHVLTFRTLEEYEKRVDLFGKNTRISPPKLLTPSRNHGLIAIVDYMCDIPPLDSLTQVVLVFYPGRVSGLSWPALSSRAHLSSQLIVRHRIIYIWPSNKLLRLRGMGETKGGACRRVL